MLNFIIPIVIAAIIAIVFIVALFRSIRIVPHKVSLIVERLGKYHTTLDAGFHILFPFLDRVKYKQNLKEEALDVAGQGCFTRDNAEVCMDV